MRLVIVILCTFFGACAVGPDYSRPDLSVPKDFRLAETDSSLPSLANLSWWKLLQDPILQKLVGIALEENKNLKQAIASIEEYQARLYVARTDFVPQVTGSGRSPSFGRTKAGFRFPGNPSTFNYSLLGELAWEMDVWGRIRRSTEAALADLLAREENRRAVVLGLVSGVAQAYFDLLQFDMQLGIARRTLESWEESVRIAKARLERGVTSRLDADQFEAERANAAARVESLERLMTRKENELSVLLGRNPSAIERGTVLTDQVFPPEVPAGLPSELLQRRPDVLQAEQELAASTARIGMAKADRFPKVTLTGILGVASPQLSKLFESDSKFGAAGFNLAGPIFNAEALGFQQDVAEAQARQAIARYEQTILVAFQEVEDALVSVQTARRQRQAQVQQVEALRSALRLADFRYQGGVTSYVDVLIAKRSLFDAELALVETHRLELVSIVQLYKALGGGWSPNSGDPSSLSVKG
ncbi:MAG: efflux transporter outer membrane subunit [Nitrospirales bacterium]|nr:efflux transporter outer membrane subunit [Nitrospira sp.]MDR4499927.1 efflux transporter outer membrane subunit [Nitrospirales bacterium]